MKKLLLLIFFALPAFSQVVYPPQIITVTADTLPMSCTGKLPMWGVVSGTSITLYQCQNGVPTQVSGGGGSSSFSTLTGGTNTAAAMLVGTGASLGPTGSGVVDGNEINGLPVPFSAGLVGTNGLGQLIPASSTAPSNGAYIVAPSCGTAANCTTIHDDAQAAMTATYTLGGTGGSTATQLTTHDNDMIAQWLNIASAKASFGGYQTVSAAVASVTFATAYKCSGTCTVANTWGTNETGATATTITVAITPTGGSGHLLNVVCRGAVNTTITITDTSNTYTSFGSTVTSGTLFANGAYSNNIAGGSYTVTCTFGATSGFRSISVQELSGIATSSPLDAFSSVGIGTGSTQVPMAALTTTGNDLVLEVSSLLSTTATATVGPIGTLSEITTQTSDVAFASTDVGKKFFGTTNCDTGNGYVNCTEAFPTGTVISFIDAHHIGVSTFPTLVSQSTGTNFTGWFLWGHDDTAAIQAAFVSASALPGFTLQLPCGGMFVDAPVFISASAGQLYNPNINGCAGAGTVLIPTPDFNFTTGDAAQMFYYPATNDSGFGITFQNPFYYTQLSNFTIWGGGVDGAAVTNASPVFDIFNVKMDNVWVVGWNWNLGVSASCIVAQTIILENVGCWSSYTQGLTITGDQNPTNAPSSAKDCFFGVQSTNLTPTHIGNGLHITAGHLTSTSCQFYPGKGGSGFAVFMQGTLAFWTSHGDYATGIDSSAGTTTLYGTITSAYNTSGITISGGYVGASGSQVDKLVMSAGTFDDIGYNYACSSLGFPACSGTVSPWTTNPHGTTSITGGTILHTASADFTALTTAKAVLTSGWGSATVTAATGNSHSGLISVTEGGVPIASPVMTITFPTQFAAAPASGCGIGQVSGTFTLSNPVISSLTATGFAVTWTGTATATGVDQFRYSCGP